MSDKIEDKTTDPLNLGGADAPMRMVQWMMLNEGRILADNYGRRWSYKNYIFYFGDIGNHMVEDSLRCLHLAHSSIRVLA